MGAPGVGRAGSRWAFGLTGTGLLAGAVAMMAVSAPSPRAQASAPPQAPVSHTAHTLASRAAQAPARLTLPAPPGRYPVGTVALHLTDPSRHNPWTASPPDRQLMISVFYPAGKVAGHPAAPQMLPAAAGHFGATTARMFYRVPAGRVDWAATRSHAHTGAPVLRRRLLWPVVLYSPGAGDDRTWSTVAAEDLASEGFAVVSIDHTYDASEVEFPGGKLAGSVLLQRLATAQKDGTVTRLLAKVVRVRVADTRFVLDELPALNAGQDPGAGSPPLPAGLAGSLDLREIGMFGVSGGGFTALQTMAQDPRIKAGIDIDGTLEYTGNPTGKHLSTVARHGLDRPFLLLGSPGTDRHDEPSWASLWAHSRGWHADLTLPGSDENSYKDAVALIPQVARDLGLPHSFVTKDIGTVNPAAAVRAEDGCVAAFFGRFLTASGRPASGAPLHCAGFRAVR